MNGAKKNRLLRMKSELDLIDLEEIDEKEEETVPADDLYRGGDGYGKTYKVTEKMTPEEEEYFLKIQAAHDIRKTRKCMQFFVGLTVFGIAAAIALLILNGIFA